ncbi:pyridoxamine 5-phosphate oxidase [Sulfurimonas aquatica]|uniref:Pyridoxamine 5-phosphate oxidase n=1 Tax=Sulfurimonas aquatica TaxID=2672570 RepID=A0A975B0X2_9BACT|nr:pyridoxamine 5'-phosphate oxidase family protein [Sulfurimonas aquatica]QSZ42103.1 pyridoxamine 5-phosphate oxidase [Sulfurimonas aquatica]
MDKNKLPGSAGEHMMQEKFNTQDKAEDFYNRQMLDYIAPHMKEFISKQEMVFLATSDKNGECDSSFRSGEAGFVIVLDEKHIIYPDFKGNGVLASLGNISENPHIGMLFIDFFENKVGLHVNGKAKQLNEEEVLSFIDKIKSNVKLPTLKQKVSFWTLVFVEEAYIHCSRNIPILKKNEDNSEDEKSRPIDFFKLL